MGFINHAIVLEVRVSLSGTNVIDTTRNPKVIRMKLMNIREVCFFEYTALSVALNEREDSECEGST
jgi:hypothetical protein